MPSCRHQIDFAHELSATLISRQRRAFSARVRQRNPRCGCWFSGAKTPTGSRSSISSLSWSLSLKLKLHASKCSGWPPWTHMFLFRKSIQLGSLPPALLVCAPHFALRPFSSTGVIRQSSRFYLQMNCSIPKLDVMLPLTVIHSRPGDIGDAKIRRITSRRSHPKRKTGWIAGMLTSDPSRSASFGLATGPED